MIAVGNKRERVFTPVFGIGFDNINVGQQKNWTVAGFWTSQTNNKIRLSIRHLNDMDILIAKTRLA